MVGHFAFREVQTRFFIGLRKINHRRPAIARVAVHMLEQMQRGTSTTIEQLNVIGFCINCALALNTRDKGVYFSEPIRTQGLFAVQYVSHFTKVRAHSGVGITH
jgi:hypothetical protein